MEHAIDRTAATQADYPGRLLVFTTCYNERENIGRLLDQIAAVVPQADILVVDDNSPDGTWDVLMESQRRLPQLRCVKRPRKLGIGSAHKYALFHAMREGYDTVVTMDADFSHDPKYLPALLAAHGRGVFVTGSRYCEGGSSDYSGYRDRVSRLGNWTARHVLGVKLRELTTYYRVFDVADLRRIPLRRISAAGYSYGVQLIYYLRKLGVELREVPIHFTDRTRGASKIPRAQIVWSALDLLKMGAKRFNRLRDLRPDHFVWDACPNCGDRVLAMKHFGSRRAQTDPVPDAAAYRCTAVAGGRNYPPVYRCLNCGLEQVPRSAVPAGNHVLEGLYEDVVDEKYLENANARRRTFRRCMDKITAYVGATPGTMLEVGAYCGLFLQEAARRGWQVDGVEPSRWAARVAREVSEVPVREGFLAQNRASLRPSYDVVVSWDVLEHVRDPAQFLRECRSMLHEGGTLCLSTLDIDSWFPRLLGRRWPWLMDMHLFYFDRAVITDLLARNGFELLATAPYAHYARVRYAITGLASALPRPFGAMLSVAARLVPSRAMIPVALGDIKLFVARAVPMAPSASP